MPPNFVLLDATLPDIARLVTAMVQARDAVERRSWSHPQEPTGEEWWADVLADPRARKRKRRTDLAVKQAFYRLADEKHETILVACSKCDWRAAFSRDDLIAAHGADYAMPNLLDHLAAPSCSRLGSNWDRCGEPSVEKLEGELPMEHSNAYQRSMFSTQPSRQQGQRQYSRIKPWSEEQSEPCGWCAV